MRWETGSRGQDRRQRVRQQKPVHEWRWENIHKTDRLRCLFMRRYSVSALGLELFLRSSVIVLVTYYGSPAQVVILQRQRLRVEVG